MRKKLEFALKFRKNSSTKYSYKEQKYEQDCVLGHCKFNFKETD